MVLYDHRVKFDPFYRGAYDSIKVFFKLINLKFNMIDHIAQHVESLAQNLD